MKKTILLLITFILSICIFTGCTSPNTYNPFISKEKPSTDYYTTLLKETLAEESPSKVYMFYREFFKEFTFPDPDIEDILSFIETLQKSDFIEKPEDLPEKYAYKVYLTFSESKYVISIYNEKYVSISSWDGDYKEDYADISTIPLSINIYGICKYFTSN